MIISRKAAKHPFASPAPVMAGPWCAPCCQVAVCHESRVAARRITCGGPPLPPPHAQIPPPRHLSGFGSDRPAVARQRCREAAHKGGGPRAHSHHGAKADTYIYI